MLRTPVRECGRKWFAGSTYQGQPGLPKCQNRWDEGHEFPDSGRSGSEPQIIEVMGKLWPVWKGRWCALATVFACLAMAGCAGVSAGGSGGSGSSNSGNPSPANAGQLSVSPATLDFGSVAIGTPAMLTGTLTAGSSDVTVSSAGWNGEGYEVSGITFPVTVPAGTSKNYTVTFTPQAAGASAGKVSFVNDGASSPVVQTFDGNGGQAGVHTVGLFWDASTSVVVGYNVYRATQSGGPYQLLTSSPQAGTSYTDGTVVTGTTYYYVTTAVDANHLESVHSNQAQAVIP
jgi:hypothetical protein